MCCRLFGPLASKRLGQGQLLHSHSKLRTHYQGLSRETLSHIYIYVYSHPPMIHPSLLVNTPAQSSVPRCLVLESESIGIDGVVCASCTYLPDFFVPLYHR